MDFKYLGEEMKMELEEVLMTGFLVLYVICILITISYFFRPKKKRCHHNNLDDYTYQENNRRFMEESVKGVIPFEQGGYDMSQGNSWNGRF